MTDDRLDELYTKAHQAHAAGQFEAARGYGKEMEGLAPADPRVWIVLAQSALGSKDLTEAAKYLTALHEKDPENLGFRQQLTEIYMTVGYFEEAVRMFRPVFDKSREVLEKYTYFGQMCALGGDEDEALKCFKKADKISPGNANIKAALAKTMLGLGDLKGANKNITAALKLNPVHIEALGLKVDIGADLGAAEKNHLENLVQNNNAHMGHRVDAAFTIGKNLNREKEYDAAFAAFERANDLARAFFNSQGTRYDAKGERDFFKTQSAFYSKDFISNFPKPEPLEPAPIFIIGLPRSGTTLVESILSAHKAIGAGGELKLLGELHLRLENLAAENPATPKSKILEQMAPAWRQEYLSLLKKKGSAAKFVTDKMPLNFPFVGLAGALFPAARFIFLEREPVDNCLSMFFQPLTQSYVATTSLESLGQFYSLFQGYLDHWRGFEIFKLYNLGYEDLAQNPAPEIKKLIDFLGLPWDEACLDFHQKTGPVRTLSMLQVREPVSAKYIGRWKNFEKHLGPLKAALEHKDQD